MYLLPNEETGLGREQSLGVLRTWHVIQPVCTLGVVVVNIDHGLDLCGWMGLGDRHGLLDMISSRRCNIEWFGGSKQ